MNREWGGPNGIYLFELEAQPGGPVGWSVKKAGSQPIRCSDLPRVGSARPPPAQWIPPRPKPGSCMGRAFDVVRKRKSCSDTLKCSYPLKKALAIFGRNE